MKDRSDDSSHHFYRVQTPVRISQYKSTMKDRSDDPSHHERTLLPRSYRFYRVQDTPAVGLFIVERESWCRDKSRKIRCKTCRSLFYVTGEVMSGSLPAFICSENNQINTQEGRKEMFYLTMHSTHFIYGYMASDIRLRTILIVRKETRCRHMGYSFRLAVRVLLYASFPKTG